MITKVYNIIEIVDFIKGEIENDITKIEFSAVKFDNEYSVGLFINDIYIQTMIYSIKEMKINMKEILRILKGEFNVKCEGTYSLGNIGIKIENEKIS
jgi:hypothetical protein